MPLMKCCYYVIINVSFLCYGIEIKLIAIYKTKWVAFLMFFSFSFRTHQKQKQENIQFNRTNMICILLLEPIFPLPMNGAFVMGTVPGRKSSKKSSNGTFHTLMFMYTS